MMMFSNTVKLRGFTGPPAKVVCAELARHFRIVFVLHPDTLMLSLEPATRRLVQLTAVELGPVSTVDNVDNVDGTRLADHSIPFAFFEGRPFQLWIRMRPGEATYATVTNVLLKHLNLLLGDGTRIYQSVSNVLQAEADKVLYIPLHPHGSAAAPTRTSLLEDLLAEVAVNEKQIQVSGRGERLNIGRLADVSGEMQVWRGTRASAMRLFRMLRRRTPGGALVLVQQEDILVRPSPRPVWERARVDLTRVANMLANRRDLSRGQQLEALARMHELSLDPVELQDQVDALRAMVQFKGTLPGYVPTEQDSEDKLRQLLLIQTEYAEQAVVAAREGARYDMLRILRQHASGMPLPPGVRKTPRWQALHNAMTAYMHADSLPVEELPADDEVSIAEDEARLDAALALVPEPVEVRFRGWTPLTAAEVEDLFPCNLVCGTFHHLMSHRGQCREFVLRTCGEWLRRKAPGPLLARPGAMDAGDAASEDSRG